MSIVGKNAETLLAMSGHFRALFFVILSTFAIATHAQNPPSTSVSGNFNQAKEFPNYFLPEKFRNLTPEQIEKLPPAESAELEKSVTQMQGLMEQALGSIYERVTLPVVKEGETKASMVRYFPYVTQELLKIDPAAKVRPSGGVVRSSIGYLYSEIYKGMLLKPPVSAEETLLRIIKDRADVPGIDIRGVGSDWDILLQCSVQNFDTIKRRAEAITNSAEHAYGMQEVKGDLKRSVFAVGDVKQYGEQIAWSTEEGGSRLDFLAFELGYDLQGHRFVEPPGQSGIMRDLIRGWWDYIAPARDGVVEDPMKQTTRGLRPFLELPFLKLRDEAVLRKELQDMLTQLKQGKKLSDKAIGQFGKAIRNARFAGAHNRFYRAAPGSIEDLTMQVTQEIQKTNKNILIPEYVDQFPLDLRDGARTELHGLPEELLTSVGEFRTRIAKDGKVFHGTSSLDTGLAIIRQGLFVSKDGQGTAAMGRGGYGAQEISYSQNRAGPDGLVFELEVPNDQRINILEWNDKVRQSPFIQSILQRTNGDLDKTFEILAREHGIDIIVNHHVLIQNTEAVRLPDKFRALVQAYYRTAYNPAASYESRFSAYTESLRLHEFAEALGETGLEAPKPFGELLGDILEHADPKEHLKIIDYGATNYKISPVFYNGVGSNEQAAGYFVEWLKALRANHELRPTWDGAVKEIPAETVSASKPLQHYLLVEVLRQDSYFARKAGEKLGQATLDKSTTQLILSRLQKAGDFDSVYYALEDALSAQNLSQDPTLVHFLIDNLSEDPWSTKTSARASTTILTRPGAITTIAESDAKTGNELMKKILALLPPNRHVVLRNFTDQIPKPEGYKFLPALGRALVELVQPKKPVGSSSQFEIAITREFLQNVSFYRKNFPSVESIVKTRLSYPGTLEGYMLADPLLMEGLKGYDPVTFHRFVTSGIRRVEQTKDGTEIRNVSVDLANIRSDEPEIIAFFRRQLKSKEPERREQAALCIVQRFDKDAKHLPLLAEAATTDIPKDSHAAYLLKNYFENQKANTPDVQKVWRYRAQLEGGQNSTTIKKIAELGDVTPEAVDLYLKELGSPHSYRVDAARFLELIGSSRDYRSTTLAALESIFEANDYFTAPEAFKALNNLTDISEHFFDLLTERLAMPNKNSSNLHIKLVLDTLLERYANHPRLEGILRDAYGKSSNDYNNTQSILRDALDSLPKRRVELSLYSKLVQAGVCRSQAMPR